MVPLISTPGREREAGRRRGFVISGKRLCSLLVAVRRVFVRLGKSYCSGAMIHVLEMNLWFVPMRMIILF